MITENLSTLKIHKLTQEQYDRELSAGRIDPGAIYLTPDISVDSGNAETLGGKTAEYFENAISKKADSNHSHSEYVNQNAFSNVKVGTTTIVAESETDTLTLVAGNNVILTPNSLNDQITISATDTVYTHPDSGVVAGTYNSVTVNAQGHVTGGSNPDTLEGYGITDAYTKNEVSEQINNALANFKTGKTLTEHLTEENMILSSHQYGTTLPPAGIPGRIFFLKV